MLLDPLNNYSKMGGGSMNIYYVLGLYGLLTGILFLFGALAVTVFIVLAEMLAERIHRKITTPKNRRAASK